MATSGSFAVLSESGLSARPVRRLRRNEGFEGEETQGWEEARCPCAANTLLLKCQVFLVYCCSLCEEFYGSADNSNYQTSSSAKVEPNLLSFCIVVLSSPTVLPPPSPSLSASLFNLPPLNFVCLHVGWFIWFAQQTDGDVEQPNAMRTAQPSTNLSV